MIILPAIDLIGGQAVRLFQGDYNQKTVYGDALETARHFKECGAEYLHVVDLEGARDGGTPNYDTVRNLAQYSGLKVEIGGGIRSMDVLRQYFSAGVYRAILGTAAVTDPAFLQEAVQTFGNRIAVGADLRNDKVAIRGWKETTEQSSADFFGEMQQLGISTVICTDIAKDGALQGTNLTLYKSLSDQYRIQIIASGGVSSLEDVLRLKQMNLYGAIIGKACYTGDIDLAQAIREAK